jgi:hypothetical protein
MGRDITMAVEYKPALDQELGRYFSLYSKVELGRNGLFFSCLDQENSEGVHLPEDLSPELITSILYVGTNSFPIPELYSLESVTVLHDYWLPFEMMEVTSRLEAQTGSLQEYDGKFLALPSGIKDLYYHCCSSSVKSVDFKTLQRAHARYVMADHKEYTEVLGVLALLTTLEEQGCEARAIYWYDW